MTAQLEMRGIGHRYHRRTEVLRNFQFTVQTGEIACLLGQSGCGKTTALRVIAGFEKPHTGEVRLAGRQVSGGVFVPPEKRSVGIVFQDAALFPHLTVAKNVAFGLLGLSKSERQRRVAQLLETMGLEAYGQRYPHQLSGGQRQRVALARAMAPKPDLILLDEPFSNLDADLRQSLGAELRRILKGNGMTAVLVTHDQNEAFTMADRIALVHEGRVVQEGSAEDLFQRPQSRFAAGFLGKGTFIPGQSDGAGRVTCAFGEVRPLDGAVPAGVVEVLIRSENPRIDPDGIQAKVKAVQFQGSHHQYSLDLPDGQTIEATLPSGQGLKEGDVAGVSLREKTVPVFAVDD